MLHQQQFPHTPAYNIPVHQLSTHAHSNIVPVPVQLCKTDITLQNFMLTRHIAFALDRIVQVPQ